MPPLVSVIIPTFNRKEKLASAIHSVLSQTFNNFELIVVDDGSDDGTALSGSIDNTDIPIYLIRLEINHGVSKARNTGVAQACGKWIAFLDSDDLWNMKKLEKQVAWLSSHPSFRIMQTREIWIRRGVRVNPPKSHEKKEGDIFEESLERCMITPSSVILERSLFDEIGGFNESLPACEDYDLWLRIACRYQVGCLNERLLTRFGGHEDQLSSSIFAPDRFRIRSLLDLIARGTLSPYQSELAGRMLVKKATILSNGYKKHGKAVEYERFKKIAESFNTVNK